MANQGIAKRPTVKQIKRQQLADRDDEEVRELRKKIDECENIEQIMDLLGDKVQDLNIICCSTAIKNISKNVIKQHPDKDAFENCLENPNKCQYTEFSPCASSSIYHLKDLEKSIKGCTWLTSDLCRQYIKIFPASKSPKDAAFSIANVVYSLGWMHYDPGGRMLEQLANFCQRHLDDMTTQGISNSLQGFAYLDKGGPALRSYVRTAAIKALDRLTEFKSTELAIAMWAMLTLDQGNQHVLKFLSKAKDLVQDQLAQYTFIDLSTILYSLAYSKLPKQDIQPLFKKIAAFEHFIPDLPPEKVCSAVIAFNAYAKTYKENYGKVPYSVRTGVGRFVYLINSNRKYLTQKDIVMTAWALGVFRLGHVKLVDGIRQRIEQDIDTYNLYDSSNLFWAMGSLKKGNKNIIIKKRVECCRKLFEHIIHLLHKTSNDIVVDKTDNNNEDSDDVLFQKFLKKQKQNKKIKQDNELVDVRWVTQIFHTSTQLNIITPNTFLELVEICSEFVQKDIFEVDPFLSKILVHAYTILKSDCDPATKMRVDQSLLMKQAVGQF